MTRPATLVLALAMSFGCGPETDSGAIEGGTAAEGEEASAGSDEEGQSVPSYPQYCGSAPPDGVSLVRAVPGNGTVQIELVVSGADPLACGDAFPQCMAQWESVVPIPSPKPATVYDHFDQLHRLYFANDVCGPGLPSPVDSEGIEESELTLYEVEPDCISGRITYEDGTTIEFVGPICPEE